MASTLEISCISCGALYRFLTKAADVTAVFCCVHCREHNLFHAGRALLLNPNIMRDGSQTSRREHIRRRMEDAALEGLASVRERITNLVNINVDIDFAKRVDPPGLDAVQKTRHSNRKRGRDSEAAGTADFDTPVDGFTAEVSPDGPITAEEVEAFRKSLDTPDFWRRLDQL